MYSLCRDCFFLKEVKEQITQNRCIICGSPRMIYHAELPNLSIAHMDCDAFYASVEKRDNPELNTQPLIIGGGTRGVVSTCCYIARLTGVRSAMPMFKALKLCPQATVLPPNMSKYQSVSREIRALMDKITPQIEPLSLDEAFLNLTGTTRLHGRTPAATMAKLAKDIHTEVGITVSVGLAANKFLAKIASDLDKPNGYSIIGAGEAVEFLADKPVSIIWGVGSVMQKSLAKEGIRQVRDLHSFSEKELIRLFGSMGLRLYDLCRARDARKITSHAPAKSISAETTFNQDTDDLILLEKTLWRLSERCSARAKKAGKTGGVITLKMKTSKFKTITRRQTIVQSTQMADMIFNVSKEMLRTYFAENNKPPALRLIGVGISSIRTDEIATNDMFISNENQKNEHAERAMDALRDRFGVDTIKKGRSLD